MTYVKDEQPMVVSRLYRAYVNLAMIDTHMVKDTIFDMVSFRNDISLHLLTVEMIDGTFELVTNVKWA